MTGTRRFLPRLRAMTLALALAAGSGTSAWAVGADRLASEIELSLSGIESTIRIQPERAVEQISDQRRMFELLKQQRPDHPRIEELEERLRELEEMAGIAVEEEDDPLVTTDDGMIEIVPPEVSDGMAEVERLMQEAEGYQFQRDADMFEARLDDADARLEELTENYGDAIPPSYSRAIVAQERLGLLREQLEDLRNR